MFPEAPARIQYEPDDVDRPITYGDIVDALLMLDRDELCSELLSLVVSASIGSTEAVQHRISTKGRGVQARLEDATRRLREQETTLGFTMQRLRRRVRDMRADAQRATPPGPGAIDG